MKVLRFATVLLVLVLFCAAAGATEDLLFYNAASVGVFRQEDYRTNALFWQLNTNRSDFFLGIDMNLLLSERKPENVDPIVVRRLEFDDGTRGLLYGPLVDYDMGAGLLLRDYSSLDRDTVLFNNENIALRGYYLGLFDAFDIEGFATWSHVYGIRVTEDVFGVIVGQTYVSAGGGKTMVREDGGEEDILPRSVAGIDIDSPLFGDVDLRAEVARMRGVGNGYLAGFHWGYNVIAVALSADLQWRRIEPGFAPNYFGSQYEINPILVTSLESYDRARNGFYGALKGAVFSYFSVNFAYETYDDSNGAFYVDSWLKVYEKLRVSAFLKQPTLADHRGIGVREGQLIGGGLNFDLSPSSYILLNVKKGYEPDIGQVQESALMEFGLIF